MGSTALTARAEIADKRLVRGFSYIGGKWTAAESGQTFPVTDPATGVTIGAVASLSGEDGLRAVDAAEAAFPGWAGRLPQERAALLRRWFEAITASREDLARIMV